MENFRNLEFQKEELLKGLVSFSADEQQTMMNRICAKRISKKYFIEFSDADDFLP